MKISMILLVFRCNIIANLFVAIDDDNDDDDLFLIFTEKKQKLLGEIVKNIWRNYSIFQTKKDGMKGEIPKEYSKLEKKTRRKNDLHIYNIKFIGEKKLN